MLRRLGALVRGWRRRDRIDAEVAEELHDHVARETARNVERGMSLIEARRAALRDLGGLVQTRESVRDVCTLSIEVLWQDLRYARRQLRRSPGFTLVATLVLSLGIGLNTAVFSVVNAVFFRPLPVREPANLVYVYQRVLNRLQITDDRDLAFFRQHTEAFSDVTAHVAAIAAVTADGQTEELSGEYVAPNYFDLLGVLPERGRTFHPEDDPRVSTEPAIVISHDLWRRRFQFDPSVLGVKVRVGTLEYSVIGVAPASFNGLADPWAPSQFWATQGQPRGVLVTTARSTPQDSQAGLIGRLRPGLTLDAAQAIVAVQGNQAQRERTSTGTRDALAPYVLRPAAEVRVPFDPEAEIVPVRVLSAVMVVAGTVLVIAAMNLAGLLMARGVSRARELAVQRALGAGLLRLVRQLVAQSVLVALAGGVVGLVVATLVLGLYRAYAPAKFVVSVPIDLRVLVFTMAVCVASGLLVGVAPALQTLKLDVISALGGGPGATSRTRARVRHWTVVPQIGLTVMLLVVGGLHVRALLALELNDPGYRVNDVVVLRLGIADWVRRSSLTAPPSQAMGERAQVFYRELVDRLDSIPRVSAGLTEELPVAVHDRTTRLLTREQEDGGQAPITTRYPLNVSPGFFAAQGIEILAGRDFKTSDSMTSTPVAIVSDSLARRLWPGENPIGKAFRVNVSSLPGQPIRWLEVIGVVNDVDSALHDNRDHDVAYQSFGQFELPLVQNLVVRGRGETVKTLAERVSQAIAPTVRVVGVRQLREIVSEILYSRRMAVAILLTSGLVGLFLASIGLYGVVSFSVAARQRELGIRASLGASGRDVIVLVLKEGLSVAGIGAVVGAGASVSLMKVAASLVGPVPTTDVPTFAVVAAVIAAVVLLASAGPARRASRVDPLNVLRSS